MSKRSYIIIVLVVILGIASVMADTIVNNGMIIKGTSRSVRTIVSESMGDHIVYKTKTGSKYHSPFCRYLRDSSIEISIEDAEAEGLDPCSRCTP